MKMKIAIVLLLISLISGKLVYLAELFRHGARYPLKDIYDGKDTKPFHGQLTSIGMRQHYLLGNYLKKDYISQFKLINNTINPKQVQIFADSSQRCIESAYAHAAGIFSLKEGEQLPNGINPKYLQPPYELSASTNNLIVQESDNSQYALENGYQPVAIKDGGFYFPKCANEQKLFIKRAQKILVTVAELQAEQALFTQKMRVIFNLSLTEANVQSLAELYDVIICDLNLGRSLPVEFTERDYAELKYIQNYLYMLLYEDQMGKIFSNPIVPQIINNMEKVINGKLDQKKLTIFSGHDSNVAPILSFLNLSSSECVKKKYKNQTFSGNCAEPVPFACNILFELHLNQTSKMNEGNSNYYVKIRYNGDYYNLCEKQSKQCNFEQFALRIRRGLADFKKECGA